jgi:hypothetical protein
MVRLIYGRDERGQEILYDDKGCHQVMMEWEKPYMEFCVDKLKPKGRVLEIGFGLGYSATKIAACKDVTEHVIIECSPTVWERMEKFLHENPKSSLVKGRWQDVMYTCGKFDCVFFDDYSTEEDTTRGDDFVEEIASQVGVGAELMFYCTAPPTRSLNGTRCIVYPYNIQIPDYCQYAKGNKMFALHYQVKSTPISVVENTMPKSLVGSIPKTSLRPMLPDVQDNMRGAYKRKDLKELNKLCEVILSRGYSLTSAARAEALFYKAYSLFRTNRALSKICLEECIPLMSDDDELAPFAKSNLAALS